MESYYSYDELQELGFAEIGNNVFISRNASIYGAKNIKIGSNVRIDDFCFISGKIEIGNYIHIAPYTSLCGSSEGIYVEDFANISRKVEIFATSDDYSGMSLTNPLIPEKYKNLEKGKVVIGRHVIIGPMSVIMPNVELKEGSALGAFSFLKTSTNPWTIYTGIPAKPLKQRKKDLLDLEELFLKENSCPNDFA